MPKIFSLALCLMLSALAFTCVRDYPATAPYTRPVDTNPPSGGLPPQQQPNAPKRLFLQNDKIRVGIDLNAGGAFTYLSEAGSTVNMVNNNDLGRQWQTAIYAGPVPYSVNGKNPVPQWVGLGWNPVQTGDVHNNPAPIISYQQSQNLVYVKNRPLIWPLLNEPADCTFEHWVELQDNVVHVRCRVVIERRDTTQYEARTQETPCIYLNGPYYRFVTYNGNRPFTNDATVEFTDRDMINRYGTENWIALLNEQGRGLGLYRDNQYMFVSAGFGLPKVGTEYDNNSGYINNNMFLLVDHNGTYEYDYYVVVGTLADVRQFAYSRPRPAAGPNYVFTNDRQGWYYYNTRDTGWPIRNELNIRWQRNNTEQARFRLMAPMAFWRATDVPKIYIHAAFQTKATQASIVFRKPSDPDFLDQPNRTVTFPIIGDGQYRIYEVTMSGREGWDGIINQMSLTAPDGQIQFEKGSTVRIKSITMTPPNG
ncbi:hypothetical protein [Spirosoma montaniterrae]|uniref:Uncharacterized protein n=1 Tax=Spirosoma montaniterrae TaxID=1178516 RepID=A0A1P9X3D1_9BACT|nr:hypothetical protein [Spirosoma montaniterrae]AQG82146.1 hypothetical protein AWR27_24335 [Spirosoma montaniterrae]